MKLNIGCGDVRIDDYLGVDTIDRGAADIIAHADKLPFEDSSISEILAIHVWEHFWLSELPEISAEWRRVLAPSGLLVLELPCLDKMVRNAVRDLSRGTWTPRSHVWAMNGDPSMHATKDVDMLHKYTWSKAEIAEKLLELGWDDVKVLEPQYHRPGRDMRVEAKNRK